MSAGGIIPESAGSIVPAVTGGIQQLKAGDMVSARVVGDLGQGKYNLEFKGRPGMVEVRSEVPLTRGQDLDLQVQQDQGKVVLKFVQAGGAAANTVSADQATISSPVLIAVNLGQAAAPAASGQADRPVGLVVPADDLGGCLAKGVAAVREVRGLVLHARVL